jgi:Anti sigma-E protein RseA, N-terminal domain
MDQHLETLSALLDGDAVDIAALDAALADAEARRGLVEFVRLRQSARDESAVPARDFAARVGRSLERRRALARLRVPLPLAAAAVLLALLGGSLIDVKWPTFERPQQAQREGVQLPQPSRVLEFDAPPPDLRIEGPAAAEGAGRK